MRLLVVLLFLLTPLQPVAAATLCVIEAQLAADECGTMAHDGTDELGDMSMLTATAPASGPMGCAGSAICASHAPVATIEAPPVVRNSTADLLGIIAPVVPPSGPRPAPPIHPPIN